MLWEKNIKQKWLADECSMNVSMHQYISTTGRPMTSPVLYHDLWPITTNWVYQFIYCGTGRSMLCFTISSLSSCDTICRWAPAHDICTTAPCSGSRHAATAHRGSKKLRCMPVVQQRPGGHFQLTPHDLLPRSTNSCERD